MMTAHGPKNAARVAASVAVISILLVGGFLAYATGNGIGTGRPAPSDDNSGSGSQRVFELRLVPLVDYLLLPEGINCSYGHGDATLSVNSTAANVSLEVGGAVSNGTYDVLLSADGINYTLGTLTADVQGEGGFHGSVQFSSQPATLSVRLLYAGATPTACINLGLIALPSPVTLSSNSTTSTASTESENTTVASTSGTGGGQLDFSLAPALLGGLSLPSGYRVGEGDAHISMTGTSLVVAATVGHANPNTAYVLDLVAAGAPQGSAPATLYRVANFTTDASGAGQASSTVSLPAGSYDLGLQIYDSSTFATPTLVMTSIPPAAAVTLSQGTTTTATSTSSPGNQSASGGYSSVLHFTIVPLPSGANDQTASAPHAFGGGNATLAAEDGRVLVIADLFRSQPNATFTALLRFGARNVTLGEVTTTNGGTGHLETYVPAGVGTYQVGLLLYAGNGTSASSLVGVSLPPLARLLVTGSAGTSTSNTTSVSETQAENQTQSAGGYHTVFRMNGTGSIPGAPSGYRTGSGAVLVQLHAGMLEVLISIRGANPNTQYNLVFELGGSRNVTIGTLVTNAAGNAEMKTELALGSGTFGFGVLVFDESTFGTPTLVMSGSSTGSVAIGPTTSQASANSSKSEEHHATVVSASESEITSAMNNGTIPAVIHISGSETSFTVLNHDFSISVGKVSGSGIVITVSAENVTGPRTFLINLNGTTAQAVESGSVQVLFDGQAIAEASSLTQVLSPQTGAPATYALVQTAGGVQMLVTVPHFSVHTIEILGISLAAVQNFLEVDAPLLAVSVVVVTLVFGAIYATRKRLYSFLI